jgi:PAS domain S-box-containing protein
MGRESGMESKSEAKAAHSISAAAPYSPAIYQQLFEWMPGSVLLLDAKAVVLDVNPAFCRQIGYSREELRGQHVSFFSKDSLEVIQRNLARLLAGETLEHDVTNIHKDGSQRYYELRETAITLPDGSQGLLALSNDITWRITAEQEKLELQRQFLHTEKLKSLGLMAGGIAHDFNNLLTIIIGNIELGMRGPGGKPSNDPMFREAIAAANRAAHLTRQMLAYTGRAYYTVAEVNVTEIVERTEELLKLTISKPAGLKLQLNPKVPLVKGDAAQLQQILLNLVTNAAEALEDKPGSITITTQVREYDAAKLALNRVDIALTPGRYVVLEVADTGAGMDESVQHRLFDPFFTTKFTGRGLGMSAVLGAVRSHNGGILVSSQTGRGTTITVLLPPGAARS